jgi:hypothetical protein
MIDWDAGSAARRMLAWLVSALVGCTPVNESPYKELGVRVEADVEVQAALDEVEVMVESRALGADSWNLEASRRFNPNPTEPSDWPLQLRIKAPRVATYQITVTSKDQAGAITIQARTIQELDDDAERELQLRLDHECLRRSSLCPRAQTCSLGECVSARAPLKARSEVATSMTSVQQVAPAHMEGAQATDACSAEGTRACDLTDERQPLVCEQSAWRMADKCLETHSCDLTVGETNGTCQPLAPECIARMPGDLYCDAEGNMHRCGEHAIAALKPCGENEHCVDVAHDVRCSCLPGFVPSQLGCIEASDCTDRGGCDPLTACEMRGQERTCTTCPAGFAGSGESGCAPLLSGLQVSPGTLDPAFDPSVLRYQLGVPILTSRVEITARSDTGAMLSIDNAPAALGAAWSSGVVKLLHAELPIELRTSTGARTDYVIDVVRGSAAQTYLKSSNCQRGGWFGEDSALHGDTIVVGAPLESVRSDDGTLVRSAGAAYVFVRDASGWRQQAVLRSNQPVTDASFGMAVDVWGDRIAIGASGGVHSLLGTGTRNGVVYVFGRSGDNWTLEQEVRSGSATESGDAFGFRLTIRDHELVAGAIYDDESESRSGAAYVYQLKDGVWTLQQRLKTTHPSADGHYGAGTVLAGDELFVSATHEAVDNSPRAGAVYHYSRSANGWTLVERMVAPAVRSLAQFGYSVSVAADTLVVSAPHNPAELESNHSGEVHVYKRDGDNFRHDSMLEHPAPSAGNYFGNRVSVTADWLAVGATGDATSGRPLGSGTVHLYGRSDQGLVRSAVLQAQTADAGDHFGDVLLGEDYIAVIAREEDGGACGIDGDGQDNSQSDSGALFIIQ